MVIGFQVDVRMIKMKRNSVIFKLFVFMLLLAFALSVVTSFYVKARVEADIAEHMGDEVNIIVDALNFAVTPLLEADDKQGINELIENFKQYEIIKTIRVHAIDGEILFSNEKNEIGRVTMSPIIDAAAYDSDYDIQSIQMDDEIMNIVVPLLCGHGEEPRDHADAVLCLELDFNYPEAIGKRIVNDLSVALVVITVIFLGILFIFVDRILRKPLRKLTLAAGEISKNNYEHRVDIHSRNELQDLALAFNMMASNIEADSIRLAEAKEIAENASEARLQFLAKMSHEIRTPLNAIIGFTDVLAEQTTEPHQKEVLDIVLSSSKHLLTLVNEVLDISKIENDKMVLESQPFSLRSLVGEVANMFTLPTQDKNIDLTYEIDFEVPIMYVGDAHRIRQVLINLVGNAVKFTQTGSIELLVSIESPMTIIKVIDTGIGIPNDKLEGIFDAYSQSDSSIARNFGGTGLGLSISRRIANMMGGTVNLSSEEGKGSTFTLELKLEQITLRAVTGTQMVERWLYADSSVEDITREVLVSLEERVKVIEEFAQKMDLEKLEFHVHSLKGVTGNFNINEIYLIAQKFESYLLSDSIEFANIQDYIHNIKIILSKIPKDINVTKDDRDQQEQVGAFKILLAEDVHENRLLIKEMLRNYPVMIDFAVNGVEAIEMMGRKAYDCLLLDIQMPLLTGVDVLKWIRSAKPNENMYIVALTANAFKEDMEKYLSLGAHWFLSKPVNKDVLRNKIKDLIQLSITNEL